MSTQLTHGLNIRAVYFYWKQIGMSNLIGPHRLAACVGNSQWLNEILFNDLF